VTRLAPTTQILSLRRLAEAEAQAALRACRGELELGQRQLESARRRLLDEETQRTRARTGQGRRETRPAVELLREAMALSRRGRTIEELRAEVRQLEAELVLRGQRLEKARRQLLACVARREAAELHEALERREQRRLRTQRERAHDDEARDRFALSRVK
jgi:hypothetical protein